MFPLRAALKARAARLMVRVLARWGYVVTHREPVVLQIEQRFDERMMVLARNPSDLYDLAIRRCREALAEALIKKEGLIEWETWRDPQYMQQHLRGRLAFFPVGVVK